jgi:LysR family cys regulon transcriptional activator
MGSTPSEQTGTGLRQGLTIATTHTQARYALVAAIMSFRQRYPRVQLIIKQDDAQRIADMVASGEADVGVATEALALHPALEVFEVYRWSHLIVVPHAHPLTRLSQITLKDLSQYPLVMTEQGIAGRRAIDLAFAAAGLKIDVLLDARDADVIKTYVEAGLGVGIIPGIAYEVTRDYGLVTLSAGHLFGEHSAKVALRRQVYVRHHVAEFLRLLVPHYRASAVPVEEALLGS